MVGHHSHSLPGEPRTCVISRVETQGTATTQTFWRAKDRCVSRVGTKKLHCNHSLPEESKIGVVSRLTTQQGTAATHKLESQRKELSADLKHDQAPQALTFWRTKKGIISRHKEQWSTAALTNWDPWRDKDRHHQQVWDSARHCSHSQTREPNGRHHQ